MLRASTPCSISNTSGSRVISPVEKENLRRQIVGLAVKRDSEGGRDSRQSDRRVGEYSPTSKKKYLTSSKPELVNTSNGFDSSEKTQEKTNVKVKSPGRIYAPGAKDFSGNKMPHVQPQDALRNAIRRSKTTFNLNDTRPKPKIVRFRMDEVTIGNQKAPIVSIMDPADGRISADNLDNGQSYEVRGNAMSVRKEGLKGLLDYRDLCNENERRQNSIHTSLQIFRRRIKLNQEKFIQPNDSTTEDYVIHSKSPFAEVHSPSPAPEERPASRPLSSNEHVRILRSALHQKHNGVMAAKQTDNFHSGEANKNIKCSYRLPDNLNFGKEVSFKDMKDDSIPNVKTYVLAEDSSPHGKYRKNNNEHAVTLNTHNLNVHNSITQVTVQKLKFGDSECSFDPRLVDWIEDSLSHLKSHKPMTYTVEEPIETPVVQSAVKRRQPAKS